EVRPMPPDGLGSLLCSYVGGRAGLVIDLGSGTGLSSRWAAGWADEVVGIEPGEDMRRAAEAVVGARNMSFRSGWGHQTGMPDGCADGMIAVQSFHWME